MPRLTNSKDVLKLIQKAEEQGWKVYYTNSGHLKWVSPSGQSVFTGSTPSDRRVLQNIKRDLKKYGFIELKKEN